MLPAEGESKHPQDGRVHKVRCTEMPGQPAIEFYSNCYSTYPRCWDRLHSPCKHLFLVSLEWPASAAAGLESLGLDKLVRLSGFLGLVSKASSNSGKRLPDASAPAPPPRTEAAETGCLESPGGASALVWRRIGLEDYRPGSWAEHRVAQIWGSTPSAKPVRCCSQLTTWSGHARGEPSTPAPALRSTFSCRFTSPWAPCSPSPGSSPDCAPWQSQSRDPAGLQVVTNCQEKIQHWEKVDNDYNALQERLRTLPDKLSYDVMVPFGPLAFMPGKLVHTNEVTVLLGDNWFAKCSAKQAVGLVEHRKERRVFVDVVNGEYVPRKSILKSRSRDNSVCSDTSESSAADGDDRRCVLRSLSCEEASEGRGSTLEELQENHPKKLLPSEASESEKKFCQKDLRNLQRGFQSSKLPDCSRETREELGFTLCSSSFT
ncbi:hypothetical protein NN561_017066 [Cricetulus griseus]